MEVAALVVEKRLGGARVSTRVLAGCLIVAMIGGAGSLAWWGCQPPLIEARTLPDGTRYALSSVTHGTVHHFDPAPPLVRLASNLHFIKTLSPPLNATDGSPQLRLWMSLIPAPQSDPKYVLFEDEHGCPFDGGFYDDQSMDGDWRTYSVRPPKTLEPGYKLQYCGFYTRNRKEAFRFVVYPPAESAPPKVLRRLVAQPLPQKVITDGIPVTLTSVEAVREPKPPHYRAHLDVPRLNGTAVTPMTLQTEDRYGHRTKSLPEWQRRRFAGTGFAFTGLCREEPAWKLIAVVAKVPGRRVPADVVWNTPDLQIAPWPSRGTPELKLHSGARDLLVSQGVSGIKRKSVKGKERRMVDVLLRRDLLPKPGRFLVTHIDGRGAQDVLDELGDFGTGYPKPELELSLTHDGAWKGHFTIPILVDAKTVSLRIAEYAGHTAEFVIVPPK